MRRTKALLSCLLALALVMLTACGARQQTVHRLSADRLTQAATVSQLQEVSDLIVEDQKIRKFLKKTLYATGVPRIEIERDNSVVRIYLHCARPGMILGKDATEVERLRQQVEKMIGKPTQLNIVEVKRNEVDTTAQLVAENIAQQLEKRTSFRRAMKNAIGRSMRSGAKGIKVMLAGRLNGAEIARSETYHEGTIPLQTLRADIDYGFAEAATTYGRIGIKVWIYKGEVLSQTLRTTPRTIDLSKPYRERSDRRRRDGRGRGGYNRNRDNNRSGGYNRRNDGASKPKEGGNR